MTRHSSPPPIPERFRCAREDLAAGDYVSPGFEVVRPDACFPGMRIGDKQNHPWRYLRREIPHLWYCDDGAPLMGFLNRDEASILFNLARSLSGARALEIGCWLGWSTAHLALGGVTVDVVDPQLADATHRSRVEQAIGCCGVTDRVHLHAAASPEGVEAAAARGGVKPVLFFIDGDHVAPAPERDVDACLPHAGADAVFVFHDLASPEVGQALHMLEARGFNILIYQTMQIMALAWRGDIHPPAHVPDPDVAWQLPHHLVGFPVSGVSLPGYGVALRERLAERDRQIVERGYMIDAYREANVELRRWNLLDIGERLRRKLGL